MQMVSAVKMRKAQQLEMESRPYREGLNKLIKKLVKKIDTTQSSLLSVDTTKAKKDLMIVVTANKGLAGAFNVNVLRYLFNTNVEFENTDFVAIGQRGAQFLSRIEKTEILANFSSAHPLNEVSAIFNFVLEKFQTGEYKTISIVYNKFITTLKSEVEHELILPLNMKRDIDTKDKETEEPDNEYVIEPSPEAILEELLKSSLEQKIRGALVSSEAVEHSARMIAMKSATDNASDLIDSLTLLSNRLRQEKITNELLDMITAKESVES